MGRDAHGDNNNPSPTQDVTYTTMKSCVKPEAMNYSFANGLQAYQAKGNEPW